MRHNIPEDFHSGKLLLVYGKWIKRWDMGQYQQSIDRKQPNDME
ncbi:hypothetical protein P2W68_01765 [Chryseobacterium arthrosphaerae]|nr:hypothetical protein [Chryseobacterium arthrosphaerae]WES98352.1 hypothetical protein P2W68_01765 [Chryseobacterium arthrosphaerae]